jgi:hypothetical protein
MTTTTELKPMYLPLELVLNVITCSLPKYPSVILPPSHPITQTLLSFTLVCHETWRLATRYLRQHCVYLSSQGRLHFFLRQLFDTPQSCNIPLIFLAPFGETIDNLNTSTMTRELLCHTSPHLKRLVIDIPLRSLYPEDDMFSVRPLLREGFMALENLEEFVSIRDELYLKTNLDNFEPPVWRRWKKLRRLALYNVDAQSSFWANVANMPELEVLVLTRADGLEEFNIKARYFQYTRSGKPLKVLLINTEQDQVRFSNLKRTGWDKVDPQKKMTITTYNVPSLYETEDPIEMCQDYVKAGALNGTLWDWEGEQIQHLPRFDIKLLN